MTNFRSVKDSGWIDADRITALIGANEAGKTNLLLPLWKLNPAKEGEINLLSDLPRKAYNEMRTAEPKPVFVEAWFRVPETLVSKMAASHGVDPDSIRLVSVTRDFGGERVVTFPEDRTARSITRATFRERVAEHRKTLADLSSLKKGEQGVRDKLVGLVDGAVAPETYLGIDDVRALKTALTAAAETQQSGAVRASAAALDAVLAEMETSITTARPSEVEALKEALLRHLPAFVYYSNYGNLDSEIYLPQVIQNLKRKDIQGKEAAKARTLKVLFEFVGLKPDEILALGEEAPNAEQAQIDATAAKKKEREVLLQSASAKLTLAFREWWKQGDYRFRFQADGRHFRIWVSDDRRPEEVELEGRSTGLQWFLSFYLVFLVESREAHKGAILLLDEPGLSLHPVAQRDLARFFENLAGTNQLLFTTHSPFLVDANHLDRVRSVYVDGDGYTVSSPDLRAGNKDSQARSVYAVHASIGLTASEGLLLGCQPVIVEGASDQVLLGVMKLALIRESKITPSRELVFLPSGGVKGVKQVAAIVLGRDDDLPYVALDGDSAGRAMAGHLREGKEAWYANAKPRVVLATDLLTGFADAEIEDLFLPKIPSVPTSDETASSRYLCSDGRRMGSRRCRSRSMFLVLKSLPAT
ncbi:MAG: ATP-binding protein, partial [Myxococcota bacterium]|nr:ATP-binding protein [Myxococcota bacterium]